MSKLTDILERFRIEEKAKSRRTVAQLAKELNKEVGLMLEQFAEAGVVFSGSDDEVLEEHKKSLLDWLKRKHSSGSEKRISITRDLNYSLFGSRWRDVAAGANGAEWDCLNEFAGAIVLGQEIDPDQQRLVNLVIAKAVIQDALPMKRVGRPSESRTDDLAMQVSHDYWKLVDSGRSSAEVVDYLSSKFHKTERQVFRYVEAKRGAFRRTKGERDQERELFQMLASLGRSESNDFAARYIAPSPDLSSLTTDDYLDHLEEVVAKEAGKFSDVKDGVFIVSDKTE